MLRFIEQTLESLKAALMVAMLRAVVDGREGDVIKCDSSLVLNFTGGSWDGGLITCIYNHKQFKSSFGNLSACLIKI